MNSLLVFACTRCLNMLKTLVVVINSNSELFLSVILTNHILIQTGTNLMGCWQTFAHTFLDSLTSFLGDDVCTKVDTFVTNKNIRSSNELFNFVLIFATERTKEWLVGCSSCFAHVCLFLLLIFFYDRF